METMLETVTISVAPGLAHQALLEQIIRQGQVQVVFQPIVQLADGELYGYEALVRGPSDSILHSPVMLFEQAARAGLSGVLDQVCIAAILRQFALRQLPGILFINVIPDTLLSADVSVEALLGLLQLNGLSPQQVVQGVVTHQLLDHAGLEPDAADLADANEAVAQSDATDAAPDIQR